MLEYDDGKTAEAIARAISPDNLKTPPGLTVRTTIEGKAVITSIEANTTLATFIATIDDLLCSVRTAEKTLRSLGKHARHSMYEMRQHIQVDKH